MGKYYRVSVMALGGLGYFFFGCGGEPLENRSRGSSLPEIPTTAPEIVCNQFEIVAQVEGENLLLSIETDLPDTATVEVSVRRLYTQAKPGGSKLTGTASKDSVYSWDYFTANEPVSHWRRQQRLFLDPQRWREALAEHQDKMAGLGADMAFSISGVSEDVVVFASLDQGGIFEDSFPKFPNLSGTATSEGYSGSAGAREAMGLPPRPPARRVSTEIQIFFPLSGGVTQRAPRRVAYNALKVGDAYRFSGEVPIVPMKDLDNSPGNAFNNLSALKELPPGQVVHIVSIRTKGGTPEWYGVAAQSGTALEGWINPIALLKVEVMKVD